MKSDWGETPSRIVEHAGRFSTSGTYGLDLSFE